ncbi:hypothetical protein ACF0H5_014404 [Mactra antiquata]
MQGHSLLKHFLSKHTNKTLLLQNFALNKVILKIAIHEPNLVDFQRYDAVCFGLTIWISASIREFRLKNEIQNQMRKCSMKLSILKIHNIPHRQNLETKTSFKLIKSGKH